MKSVCSGLGKPCSQPALKLRPLQLAPTTPAPTTRPVFFRSMTSFSETGSWQTPCLSERGSPDCSRKGLVQAEKRKRVELKYQQDKNSYQNRLRKIKQIGLIKADQLHKQASATIRSTVKASEELRLLILENHQPKTGPSYRVVRRHRDYTTSWEGWKQRVSKLNKV